jgi:hypothetical protein
MYQAMKWMLILAALLLAGSGSALILALPSKRNGDLISTQRFRYLLLASAALLAAVPIVGTSLQLGMSRSIRILFEFRDVSPLWGTVSIVLMTFHVLTTSLWLLLAFYVYKRPTRFAHMEFVREDGRIRRYYVLTDDVRNRVHHPTLWDKNLRPADKDVVRATV